MNKTFSLVFTGISGSGKTTLAKRVSKKLNQLGTTVQLIDGDDFRKEIGNLFGYTRDERMKNNCVARTIMKYLNKNNINVIFTLVAPYEEMRNTMREALGNAYIEVYAKCPVEICAKRDVKGYYKKHKEGLLTNLNGADDIYEIPQHSEVTVDTEHYDVEQCVGVIIDYLRNNGYVKYRYITNNNLKNRQDYMYSEYGGEEFLTAYSLTRENFIINCNIHEDIKAMDFLTEDSKSLKGNETNQRLRKLMKSLEAGTWTKEVKAELDYYVKAFEVRKKLYDGYEQGVVRPKPNAKYDCIDNYFLLSNCAYLGYNLSNGLKYLNAMLKLDDTLLSVSDTMNDSGKIKLCALLKSEINSIAKEKAAV